MKITYNDPVVDETVCLMFVLMYLWFLHGLFDHNQQRWSNLSRTSENCFRLSQRSQVFYVAKEMLISDERDNFPWNDRSEGSYSSWPKNLKFYEIGHTQRCWMMYTDLWVIFNFSDDLLNTSAKWRHRWQNWWEKVKAVISGTDIVTRHSILRKKCAPRHNRWTVLRRWHFAEK